MNFIYGTRNLKYDYKKFENRPTKSKLVKYFYESQIQAVILILFGATENPQKYVLPTKKIGVKLDYPNLMVGPGSYCSRGLPYVQSVRV